MKPFLTIEQRDLLIEEFEEAHAQKIILYQRYGFTDSLEWDITQVVEILNDCTQKETNVSDNSRGERNEQ